MYILLTIVNYKYMNVLTKLLIVSILILLGTCSKNKNTDKSLEELKLFLSENQSEYIINAQPPTGDYEEFSTGKFSFNIDTIKINQILKYKTELEPMILEKIDDSDSWLYLATFLKYSSAVAIIKNKLLNCDKFYGWEGPDYTKKESYMEDAQYCYQLAYIAAIEYITKKPIKQAIALTNQELNTLIEKSKKCKQENIDNEKFIEWCAAYWLLEKLRK